MKILLCNIALRPESETFPPVACTNLCNALIKAGYDPQFYDIDAKRPSRESLFKYFEEGQFDVVGISAVVSTGYKYTKYLAGIIKEASPKTQIILGGNLAASYEVILRKCQIDVCVIGEGEIVLLNLVKHLEKYKSFKPSEELSAIKGIVFLDSYGTCKFTGYEQLIKNYEIGQPDYGLLEKYSNINQYILDPMSRYDFAYDPRSHETHRLGKKMATIFTSKGCINRCTFCHRWINGYRVIPVQDVIATIKHLMEKYNVGFFCISDECFGENKQWNDEFIESIRPLDVLFQVGGARVSIVHNDPAIIRRLKEAGLTAIYFGVESGSDKILKVMEKNATREENFRALKICSEAGVYTIIQLVIGMPGENDQTIEETIEFLKMSSENLPYFQEVSLNYLQALPGTPCYELLRCRGFLGKSIEDEERYLLKVSNINASEFRHYINVSEEPLSKIKLGRMKIWTMNTINWLRQHNWKFPESCEEKHRKEYADKNTPVYNIKYFLKHSTIVLRIIDFMGDFFWRVICVVNYHSIYGVRKGFLIMLGIIKEEDMSRFKMDAISLKKFLQMKVQ
ncbi:MAG: radical SAM protein [Proteobacteria bacterium]|nr:radical SAM protein [Pseudomonadota bacterium]